MILKSSRLSDDSSHTNGQCSQLRKKDQSRIDTHIRRRTKAFLAVVLLILLSTAHTLSSNKKIQSVYADSWPSPWDISWLPSDQNQIINAINSIITDPSAGGRPDSGLAGYGDRILYYATHSIDDNPAGVNPAFALAMFRKESNFAKPGTPAYNQNNPGNIRRRYGAIDIQNGFAVYRTMDDGIKAYFWLLQSGYKPPSNDRCSGGCQDITAIITRYCPPSDCGHNGQDDVDAYIAQVGQWTQDFQSRIGNVSKGDIGGLVKNIAGQVVSGATVTFTSGGTTRTTTTGGSGSYLFSNVLAGPANITAFYNFERGFVNTTVYANQYNVAPIIWLNQCAQTGANSGRVGLQAPAIANGCFLATPTATARRMPTHTPTRRPLGTPTRTPPPLPTQVPGKPWWLLEFSKAQKSLFETEVRVRVSWTGDFSAFRLCFNGANCQETSATELVYLWNNNGWPSGYITLSIQYRRKSDGGDWSKAQRYEEQYYLSPNRNGVAPCDGGDGAYLRSGTNCIRILTSQRDLSDVGWGDRSDLVVSVRGLYEAIVYDDVDYQGVMRIIKSGEEKGAGGNTSSIRIFVVQPTPIPTSNSTNTPTPTNTSTPTPILSGTPPATPIPTLTGSPTDTPLPDPADIACAGGGRWYWPNTEGSGNIIHEICSGYDGYWTQGVNWGLDSEGPYTQYTGGTGPRITINGPDLSDDTCLTVEIRMMPGPDRGPLRVIDQMGIQNGGQLRFVLDYSGSRLTVWGATGDGQFWFCETGRTDCLPSNVWTHLAFQICDTQVWLYYNGQLVDSGIMPYPQVLRATGATTEIGTGESIYNFDGKIQYIRISEGIRNDFLLSRP